MTSPRSRILLAASVLALPLGVSGCATVALDGTVASETRAVSDFTAIDFGDAGSVHVTVGPAPSLEVTADTALLPKLHTSVTGGTLNLDGLRDARADMSSVVYTVTVPSLDRLDFSGSGDVTITGVDSPRLDLDLSGSGDVTFDGRCDRFVLDIVGSGRVRAAGLEADDVSIELSGSADVAVWARATLTVEISGSGDVTYVGDPVVHQSIPGSGSVFRAR